MPGPYTVPFSSTEIEDVFDKVANADTLPTQSSQFMVDSGGVWSYLQIDLNFIQPTTHEEVYPDNWVLDSKIEQDGTVSIYTDSGLTTGYTLGTTVTGGNSLYIVPSAAGAKAWIKGRRAV